MKKHTLLKRATAAALLSATLAAPAVIGLTAGTASAMPIESPNCRNIQTSAESSFYMANVAKQQGNHKAYAEHIKDARRSIALYNRHCL
jgi:hypothetical protein